MKSTVAFHEFDFDEPFALGHICTGPEADALNAARKDKLAASIRKAVETLNAASKETNTPVSDSDLAAIQATLNETAASFVFEEAGPAEEKLSPEEREAIVIARGLLSMKLREAGITAKAYGKEKVAAKITEFSARDDVMKEAKKNVANRMKLANVEGEAAISL